MAAGAMSFVVDASVGAAWFLPDEANPLTESALQATATHEVWVPALWLLEVGNLLLRAQRRKRISADKRSELSAAASALHVKVDREPVAISTLDEIAFRHGLSAYDAAYLELAMRRRMSLATQDDALIAAMVKAGVPAPALHAAVVAG